MALDGANFIAELSITDPPGSDPLSQGDDQIRTCKRATQQSFPNIDAAVTLTTSQMNLAAIKNEVTVFTVEAQQFTNSNQVKKSTDTQIAGWLFKDSGAITRWSQFIATLASGETFNLRRHDVLGANIDDPFKVRLTDGVVEFLVPPEMGGAAIWVAGEIRTFAISATPGANWFVTDGLNGTINLEGRFLQANNSFDADFTNRNAELGATAAAGASGATAISIAQMPAHAHDIRGGGASGITDVTINSVSNETVVGGNRGNTAGVYVRNNSQGNSVVRAEGGGTGHTHTTPATDVTVDDPTFVNAVRPLSRTVAFFQYVP